MSVTFTQSDLAQFYGTEGYTRHWTKALIYTDGVAFLEAHGAAWLVDAIASHQINPKLNRGMLADFQVWELKVKEGKAVLTCKADSGKAPVVMQSIEFTDFPLDSITLYVERGHTGKVLMLPSER